MNVLYPVVCGWVADVSLSRLVRLPLWCWDVSYPSSFSPVSRQRAKYRDFVGRNVCEKDTLRECDIVLPAMNGTFPLPILMLESVLDGDSTAFRHRPPEGSMS